MKKQYRHGAIELLDNWRNGRGWGQYFLIFGRKLKSSSDFAWCMFFPRNYFVQSCSCLSTSLFMTAWMWPVSARFDRVAVVSKVLSSCRFHADEQWSNEHLPFSLRAEQQFELSPVGYPHRERWYQRPGCAKRHRGACSGWGEASCQHWDFWNCFIQRLLCSILAWVPELGSPGRVRELLAGTARPCSLKEERGVTLCSPGTVFCYLCFRGRWQDSKGRRKKGKQIRKLAPEK